MKLYKEDREVREGQLRFQLECGRGAGGEK